MEKGFWRLVFSESDGTPSFSRCASALLVCFACGWVTHIVWRNHALPELAGLALFITVLYGANVVKNATRDPGKGPGSGNTP